MFGRKRNETEVYEYTVVPVIQSDDELIHTDAHPFCEDLSCPCHENQDNISQTNKDYQSGLLSRDDADRRYRGKKAWW